MVDVPATGTITVRMLLTDPWVESEASGDASAKKSKLLRKLDRKEEKEKLREEKEKLREEKEQKVREERQRSKTASLGSMPPPNTSTLNGNNIDLSPYLKMNEEPIKEGMLEIKSLGIWHKRWFVLYENGILAYHKPHKKDEPLGDCYGLVVLSKCRTVLSQKNRKHEERIEIEHTEKKPIFSTHSLTGKKLTSALAHHRGKAHDCTLRVTSSEDTQRWVLALRFASKESDADPLEGLGAINEEGTSTAESSDVMTAVACASDDSSNSDDDDNNNNESDDNSSKAKETARHAEHVGDHHSPHKKDEASSSVTTSTTASTTPAPAPTPTSAPAKERVSFAALASAPMPGPARGRGHSGPLLHQRHMSDEGKAKEAQADVSSAPAKEANAFVASGGRYVEEGTLKIQTKTGWAKYAFRLYTNGHLAYFHPDFEEPLGLIALRNCQLVQTSLAKLRQAIGGGDKSYLEFQIVNPSAEPLFVGAQPALGLPTVRGKAGLSPELAAQAAYEDIPALDRCRLRAKNHRLLTRWTTAIRDEITLQLAREELVGLDAFGGKEEKIDDDFLGYANLMSRPTIRLDVQVHIGRALRLDWLPHFQQVISAAIEKGIKKKLVYPARMECFIPYPGRKLDVDLVAPPAPQPVIVAPGAGAPAPTKKNKKIWDIYTYLDSKKNQKKIKVVAQFIDEILNKADYSRIKALFSPDCVLSGGAGGGGGKGSFQRGAGHEGVQDLVSLIHKTYPGIAFYIECVLVDEKTVLCQFKARSAANSETVILQGFFISRVEKRRITEQQHYWSLTAIERHHQRTAADHSSSPAKPPPTTSYC
ncbi:PH domain containing protein [Acanthamoeba castellanii str. Neff]|uniref:PH domain containing protein n=1 Tax=Acanthamoeba castellanii (strain ATCC 30010 / Neff) TaxID=1257118 RepID=L8GSZ7_ACACF|nr:PH domain containing protein [Acanthamoeba castellanii str. Neff]ELR16095.1 PH domain containing protein [Acanthamoeba castellanii str. Neff]